MLAAGEGKYTIAKVLIDKGASLSIQGRVLTNPPRALANPKKQTASMKPHSTTL